MRRSRRAAVCLLAALWAGPPIVPAGQERHEIDVRGTKIPFRENPEKDAIVIEGEALRRLPAFTLAEIIGLAANLNIAGRGLFQADLQMPGFNQEQIAVWVDGIPFNNAQTGHHNLLLPVSTSDIDRIEIFRGGRASRFGSSGGGGRINIVTASGNRLSLRRGSFGTTDFSAAVGSSAVRASAGCTETSGYADGLDGRRLAIRAGGRVSGNNSVLDAQAGYVGARFGAFRFYGPYPSGEEVSRLLGSISAAGRLGSFLSGRIRLSGEASRDDFLLYRTEPDRYRNIHKTRQAAAEVEFRGNGPSFDYAFGMTASADGISSDGVRGGAAVSALGRHRRAYQAIAASLEKESGDWSWRLGIESGFGDYRGTGGSLFIGRTLLRFLRLSGTAARTFRIPTYTELHYSDPLHLSNPALSAERTDSVSVSMDGAIGIFSFGGRAFFNRTAGLIDWIRREGETVWRSANMAAGSFSGIDLRGEWSEERLSARLLYTFQRTRFSAGPGAEAKYHFHHPDHSLSLILSCDFEPWSVSGALKIERKKKDGRVRPYLAARFRRKAGRFEIFADIQNLFNQRVERVPGLPEAPRSAGLGLAWGF